MSDIENKAKNLIVVEKTKTHDIYFLDGEFFAVPSLQDFFAKIVTTVA